MNAEIKFFIVVVMVIGGVTMLGLSKTSCAGLTEFQKVELRYCGKPERWANGKIKRNRTLIKLFEQRYPLPSYYQRSEWSVDHIIPLANGGCDAIINLQWLPISIKATNDPDNKDRWERKLYPRMY